MRVCEQVGPTCLSEQTHKPCRKCGGADRYERNSMNKICNRAKAKAYQAASRYLKVAAPPSAKLMRKPCRKCGAIDRSELDARCKTCARTKAKAHRASAEMMRKPCIKCGAIDRYKNGRCRPCTKAYQKLHAPTTTRESVDLMRKPCIKCGAIDRYETGNCRPCGKAIQEAWAFRNADIIKAKKRDRHKADPEKKRLVARRYYERNKESILAKDREFYALNSKRIIARCMRWYAKNARYVVAKNNAWSKTNPERTAAYKMRHDRKMMLLKRLGQLTLLQQMIFKETQA